MCVRPHSVGECPLLCHREKECGSMAALRNLLHATSPPMILHSAGNEHNQDDEEDGVTVRGRHWRSTVRAALSLLNLHSSLSTELWIWMPINPTSIPCCIVPPLQSLSLLLLLLLTRRRILPSLAPQQEEARAIVGIMHREEEEEETRPRVPMTHSAALPRQQRRQRQQQLAE